MPLESYRTFTNKIARKIYERNGRDFSSAQKIAMNIVDKVNDTSGGGMFWKMKFTHGEYDASHYSTLENFLTDLSNITIPTNIYSTWQNRQEFRALQAKFNSTDAIEALNAFCEKYDYTAIKRFKEQFNDAVSLIKGVIPAVGEIVKNDAKSLNAQRKKNYQDWKKTKTITYEELRTKLLFYKVPGQFIKVFMALFGSLNSIIMDNEVTIGVLPLGGMGIDSPMSVTLIDVAHSNKIVKYRAVGSIYLAHQVGGKDSIRISGRIQGPMKLWFLTAIWILTILSQGYWQTMDWEADLVKIIGGGGGVGMRDGVLSLLPSQKIDNIITQKPGYEKHITYPVITEHEIITNAYIETFSFEEQVERGIDIINYDILMRTYVEPKEFLADKKRSIMRVGKQETFTEQVLKYALNFTYRMVQMGKEGLFNIDNNSWKVDNYYELDPLDVGFTMGLAMAGVVHG